MKTENVEAAKKIVELLNGRSEDTGYTSSEHVKLEKASKHWLNCLDHKPTPMEAAYCFYRFYREVIVRSERAIQDVLNEHKLKFTDDFIEKNAMGWEPYFIWEFRPKKYQFQEVLDGLELDTES